MKKLYRRPLTVIRLKCKLWGHRLFCFSEVYFREHLRSLCSPCEKNIKFFFVISCGFVAFISSNFHWSRECHSNQWAAIPQKTRSTLHGSIKFWWVGFITTVFSKSCQWGIETVTISNLFSIHFELIPHFRFTSKINVATG